MELDINLPYDKKSAEEKISNAIKNIIFNPLEEKDFIKNRRLFVILDDIRNYGPKYIKDFTKEIYENTVKNSLNLLKNPDYKKWFNERMNDWKFINKEILIFKYITENERDAIDIIYKQVNKYILPIFVEKVKIDEYAVTNINVEGNEIILKLVKKNVEMTLTHMFIHEQFHSFKVKETNDKMFLEDVKREFPNYKELMQDFEKFNPSGMDVFLDMAFHLSCCWNTMVYMKKIYPGKYLEYFSDTDPSNVYRNFELYVIKEFEKIKKFLGKWNMIYNQSDYVMDITGLNTEMVSRHSPEQTTITKKDLPEILEKIKKIVIDGEKNIQIKGFEIYIKTDFRMYKILEITSDEVEGAEEIMQHIRVGFEIENENAHIYSFSKYDNKKTDITTDDQMNFIFDMCKILNCRTITLNDNASIKINEKERSSITLYNILNDKSPYYSKRGFKLAVMSDYKPNKNQLIKEAKLLINIIKDNDLENMTFRGKMEDVYFSYVPDVLRMNRQLENIIKRDTKKLSVDFQKIGPNEMITLFPSKVILKEKSKVYKYPNLYKEETLKNKVYKFPNLYDLEYFFRAKSGVSWMKVLEKEKVLYFAELFVENTNVEIITFPENEIEEIKDYLDQNFIVSTHRIKDEYNKYEEGHVYLNIKLGFLKVINIIKLRKIENSPVYKELEKIPSIIDEIKKNTVNDQIDFIEFVRYQHDLIYHIDKLYPKKYNKLFNDNPLLAIIAGLKIKHFPVIQKIINDSIIIIETKIDGIKDNFDKPILLNTVKKIHSKQDDDNWRNFKEHEYYYDFPVPVTDKKKIKNAYDYLIDNGVKFIKYKEFNSFINNKIKEAKKKYLIKKVKKLYHGSPVNIKDKYIKPMNDGFEKESKIWATSNKNAALLFSVKRYGTDIFWGNHGTEIIWILETVPGAMDVFKNKKGYLYELKYVNFENEANSEDNIVFHSPKASPIMDKKIIDNVYTELAENPGIVIIRYDEFEQIL